MKNPVMLYREAEGKNDGVLIWGHRMLTKIVDKSEVTQHVRDGWETHPQPIIDFYNTPSDFQAFDDEENGEGGAVGGKGDGSGNLPEVDPVGGQQPEGDQVDGKQDEADKTTIVADDAEATEADQQPRTKATSKKKGS